MRLLFDQNTSFRITKKLAREFPDCMHLLDCGLMDCEDSAIWEYAKRNGYTIVTFDADFYDISLINGYPPKIIWIRAGNLTTSGLAQLLISKKATINQFLTGDEYDNVFCLEIDM